MSSLKTCYDNVGLQTSDLPCDPNAEVSACCGAGSICEQNYYCKDPYGDDVPGTCTDQQWGVRTTPNPACPCRGYYKNNVTALNYLDSVTFCQDGSVCCGISNDACCSAGKGNPVIAYNNPAVIPSATVSLSAYYASLQVTTSSVATSSSISGSSSTNSMVFTTTVSSSPTASGDSASSNSGLSSSAQIGIGVGVGVTGLLLLVALLSLFLTRRRYTQLKQTNFQDNQFNPPSMAQRDSQQYPRQNPQPYQEQHQSHYRSQHQTPKYDHSVQEISSRRDSSPWELSASVPPAELASRR